MRRMLAITKITLTATAVIILCALIRARALDHARDDWRHLHSWDAWTATNDQDTIVMIRQCPVCGAWQNRRVPPAAAGQIGLAARVGQVIGVVSVLVGVLGGAWLHHYFGRGSK